MKSVEQMQSDAASYSFCGTSRNFYTIMYVTYSTIKKKKSSLTRVAKGASIKELVARASPGKLPS